MTLFFPYEGQDENEREGQIFWRLRRSCVRGRRDSYERKKKRAEWSSKYRFFDILRNRARNIGGLCQAAPIRIIIRRAISKLLDV